MTEGERPEPIVDRRGDAGRHAAERASSEGAVVQMTRTLAPELAPHGVTVNALCPGPFLTEMNIPTGDTEDGRKFVVGATALKRRGRIEEIQGAAIVLASDASSYVTGSMLAVDGGGRRSSPHAIPRGVLCPAPPTGTGVLRQSYRVCNASFI